MRCSLWSQNCISTIECLLKLIVRDGRHCSIRRDGSDSPGIRIRCIQILQKFAFGRQKAPELTQLAIKSLQITAPFILFT